MNTGSLMQIGIMLIGAFIFFIIYIRIATAGKILCHFEENGISRSKFLKEDKVHNVVRLGKIDDAEHCEEYIISRAKNVMTMTPWPGGLPSFMQVDVRTLKYVRGCPVPYNGKGEIEQGRTAHYLAIAVNEKMLEARFKSLERELGIKGNKAGKWDLYILIGVAVTVLVSGYGLLIQMQSQKVLKMIFDTLHGVATGAPK